MAFLSSIDRIEKYPNMIINAITNINKIKLPIHHFDKIVICGMGGSAISGDLLQDFLRDTLAIPIQVSREYHLPSYVDEETLVFCVSYSGNTEETLSQFVDAIKKGCKIIPITSNGKLEEWSKKLNLQYIKAPLGLQPRAALLSLFIPMVIYIQNLGLIDVEADIRESINVIKSLENKRDLDEIAKSLLDQQISIYASSSFGTIARRLKTQLNENAKIPASYAIFPELNHNEIMGYYYDVLIENLSVIIIRTNDEPKEISVRIEITKQLLRNKVKIVELWSQGKSKLAKIFSLLYKTDYLSVKLAELYDVDIESITNITFLKNELKEQLNLVEELEKELLKKSHI